MNIIRHIKRFDYPRTSECFSVDTGLKRLKHVVFQGIERFNDAIVAKSFNQKLGTNVHKITKENLYRLSDTFKNISIFNRVFSLDLRDTNEQNCDYFGCLQAVCYSEVQPSSTSSDVIELIASTVAMSSKILAYGAYCYGVTQIPFSSESIKLCTYIAGPWWASSIWADRVVYDFFRSALTDNPTENNAIYSGTLKTGIIPTLLSYEYHEEINQASKAHQGIFCFCALMVLSLYSSVWWYLQPPVSKSLLEKGKHYLPTADVLKNYNLQLKQENFELEYINEDF